MIVIHSHTNDPFFNIASEEYLLKNSDEDILFFYSNLPSVIIGKHQIHNQEVNIPFITKQQIPVIRRISGGGSVFHDSGNLNYAIISSSEKAWVDFEKFTQPLLKLLKKMGLSPELRSKSDIRLSGKKISGNASHIFKNRVLHHGSILFNTDLDLLTNCLKNTPTKYINNSVQSRRSIVTNIALHLSQPMSLVEFQQDFTQMLIANRLISEEKKFNNMEILEIQKLSNEKYQTAEWNILYNANYQFRNTFLQNGNLVKVAFSVKKGICNTDGIEISFLKDFQILIKDVPHETNCFKEVFKGVFTQEQVLNYFF